MVFSGSRDLFQRIGRVVASGALIEIDMKIGRLMSKERKVHFLFDQALRETVIMVRTFAVGRLGMSLIFGCLFVLVTSATHFRFQAGVRC